MSAGWAPVARAPIAHKERVAALVDHPCRTRVRQRCWPMTLKDGLLLNGSSSDRRAWPSALAHRLG